MNGILYIAYDKHPHTSHVREAILSAESVKKAHPELHITLFTDKPVKSKVFDDIKLVSVEGVRVKQLYLYDSPYDRTLFLDTDTKVVGRLDGVFSLLDRFDLAAALDHERKSKWKSDVYIDYAKIPDCFSEHNSGVVLFRKNETVKEFFSLWQKNYVKWTEVSGKFNDQPSFRVSLWQSKELNLYTLPPEFNIRTQDKRDKSKTIIPRIYVQNFSYLKANLRVFLFQ